MNQKAITKKKTITKDELKAVLDSHELWLQYGKGERAVLDNTDLSGMGEALQGGLTDRVTTNLNTTDNDNE